MSQPSGWTGNFSASTCEADLKDRLFPGGFVMRAVRRGRARYSAFSPRSCTGGGEYSITRQPLEIFSTFAEAIHRRAHSPRLLAEFLGSQLPPASARKEEREYSRAYPLRSYVIELILVGFAYFTLADLGLRLASIHPNVTPIWPPTGVAIAGILLWGYRTAPAIFVSAFLINQLTAGSIFTSLAIACGNTLEPLIAVYLVRHLADGDQVFDTPTGIAKFALISLAATLVSATIGVSSLTLAGYAEGSSFIPVWLTWWLGDLAGALVVAPVVVLWAKSEPSLAPPQITRTGLTYLAAAAVGVMVFSPVLQQTALRDALAFLVIPPLLWASLRQGPRDTATVALIISGFAAWGTLMHGGPFAELSQNGSLMLLLAFMISTSVLSLALSTEVAMTHRIENEQRRRAEEMEVLWQATVQVAFGGSFEDLFRGCLERICRLTGWPAGHVYLPDDSKRSCGLRFSPVWYFERQELAPLACEIAGTVSRFGEGDEIWATEKQLSLKSSQLPRPIPLRARRKTLNKYGLHAAFAFPLYAEGKLQAVVEFFSSTRQPPDKHLLHIVGSIGEQLGRVLERRQNREQQRQTMAISDALNLTTIRSQVLESTLDALTSGVYLTDCHGRILYMNQTAKGQVATGNVIRLANSRLASINRMANVSFTRALDYAIGDKADLVASDVSTALRGGEDAGLVATILPLARGESSRIAAIFVQDPNVRPAIPGEALADLYGLTQSELRVLLAMATGACVKEASQELQIGETTAKTHLQRIYAKTNTSKQTELMRLVMSFTPPVRAA
jgi:integral membrane sensor domain MASE1/DNA-binding CsgD family transcriptional regulator